jgi:chromosome segregation ATPase
MSVLAQHQREIESLSQERVKIEDEIFKKLQDKLTADKAAQYSDKLRKEQKEKLREIERNLAKIENEIAKAKLEGLQTTSLNEALERDISMLNKEIEDKNKIISKSESEINQRVLVIARKQDQIDLYNKKIEALIEKAGVRKQIISTWKKTYQHKQSTLILLGNCKILFKVQKTGSRLIKAFCKKN